MPVIAGKELGQPAFINERRLLLSKSMNLDKAIQLEGTIRSVLPGTMFRVALANERLVLAHISGKMRKRFIRLTIGDRVKLEMSPYDTDKARIVYRLA
jgi:translation initiation factor IF-1